MAEQQSLMIQDRYVTPAPVQPSGLHTEFQNHLADSAKSGAERMVSHNYAARGVQFALPKVSHMPTESEGVKSIPILHEVSRHTELEPGDWVVIGRADQGPQGNSFTVTYDMKAFSDHVASIPALDKFPEVHIFRAGS
jgi:hypothetical protein